MTPAVLRLSGPRRSVTKKASVSGFILARSASHALIARISSPRSGCVVESPALSRLTCNTRLSVSTWDKYQAAGLRHAQAMPEHQQQQTAVAGLVASAIDSRYELIDFGRNQVFAVAHRF